MLFELGPYNQSAIVSRPSVKELNSSTLAQIAQCVASAGQLVNISDINEWLCDHTDICNDGEIQLTQAILCMPIVNGQKKVIGVTQLISKVNKYKLFR